MKASDMKDAISRAKSALLKGDPDEALIAFAAEVQGGKGGCAGCGQADLCFKCKLNDVLGERATMALPFLLPQIVELVKEWHAGRGKRKAAEPGPGRRGRHGPPPPPGSRGEHF